MSREYSFTYALYLISPLQDVRLGSHTQTLAQLNAIAPMPIRPTAQVFGGEPEPFFFPLDGHINVMDARKIAEFLIAEQGPP